MTKKKVTAVPGRERIDNHWVWFWKGGVTWHYIFLSQLGLTDWDLRRAVSGKNSHTQPTFAGFPRTSSAGFGIYQNLAKFSINFIFSFPFDDYGNNSNLPEKSLGVPDNFGKCPNGHPPLKVDIGVLVRSLTWQSFVCGHVVFSEWKNNSDRGWLEWALKGV